MLHGGMTTDERTEAQRQFNESGTLLLATDAASEGLNLHHRCRAVVHYELPWRPLRLQQRAGRVDRIGQRRKVHELFLVAADTAERLVLAPLVRRLAGARQATAGAARLFESLGESRVAAAVLTGVAIEPDSPADPATACTREIDLREAGRRETEQLIERRSWQSMSGARPESSRAHRVVTALDGRSPRCVVIYRLTLRGAQGQLVHAELLPVAIHPADPVDAPIAGDVRRAAMDVLDRADASVRRQLRDHVENIRESVAAAHARAAAEMRARERAIASRVPSVARQLVQAGLFDRRAVRSADARRHVHDDLLEEAAERVNALDPSASLTDAFEAVAVLLR